MLLGLSLPFQARGQLFTKDSDYASSINVSWKLNFIPAGSRSGPFFFFFSFPIWIFQHCNPSPRLKYLIFFLPPPPAASRQTLPSPPYPSLTRPRRPHAASLCQVLIRAKESTEGWRRSVLHQTDLCAREIKKEKRGPSVRFTSSSSTTAAALETDVLGHAGRRPYLILPPLHRRAAGRAWDGECGESQCLVTFACMSIRESKDWAEREFFFVLMERNFGRKWRKKSRKAKMKRTKKKERKKKWGHSSLTESKFENV